MQLTDEQIVKQLGEAIREHRLAQGLTQLDLGSRCAMEEAAIRRLELGKHSPTFKTILRVCRGLGISLLDLFAFVARDQDKESR